MQERQIASYAEMHELFVQTPVEVWKEYTLNGYGRIFLFMIKYRVIHKFNIFTKKIKVYLKSDSVKDCCRYAKYLETYIETKFLSVQVYDTIVCPSWCEVTYWRDL